MYCDSQRRILIQRSAPSCTSYEELTSVGTSSCGYLSNVKVEELSKRAQGVYLQDFSRGTATSICGAVDALSNRLAWHDTKAQWETTGSFCFGEPLHPRGCPLSEVFEWPNMYCSPNKDCAHWQAPVRHSATNQLSAGGSQTWLVMRPVGNPSICSTLAKLPGYPNEFIFCDSFGNSYVKTRKPVSSCPNDNIGLTVLLPGTNLVCRLYPTSVVRASTQLRRSERSPVRFTRSRSMDESMDTELENYGEIEKSSDVDEYSLTAIAVSALIAALISFLVGAGIACLVWTKLAKQKNAQVRRQKSIVFPAGMHAV